MWQCPKCGWAVQDSAKMCRNCGTTHEAALPARPAPAARHDTQDAAKEIEARAAAPERRASWVCVRCGERVPGAFDVCWKCQTDRNEPAEADPVPEPTPPLEPVVSQQETAVPVAPQQGTIGPAKAKRTRSAPRRRVAYRCFNSRWDSWDALFQEAANFATRIGPERLISISHSEDENDGVVAVWYWEDE